ncbi:DUF192 domain-containing protein [Candidatus Woesearchaeota archaeon]|nr:DUF192 domain-containing protein [Candidatus Woesearchaeota archaeon]
MSNKEHAKNMRVCKTFLSKTLGLMFQKPKPLLMVFEKPKIVALHSFFVFGTIDVYFLNEKKEVMEKTRMKPFSLYTPKNKAKYILELPKAESPDKFTHKF